MEIAERLVAGPQGMKLLVAIAAGILGAVIAIFLQKAAIAIAGFVIGGYITVELLRASALFPKALAGIQGMAVSVPYIIGGIIGAVLLFVLFVGVCAYRMLLPPRLNAIPADARKLFRVTEAPPRILCSEKM